ncbi:MAG: DUF1775 domain-containing protein [Thermoleophilia bacterium]
MRRLIIAGLAGAALLGCASGASAHVQVLPATAVVRQSQEFTIRVPTERPLPTVGVEVTFPKEVDVYAFRPPPPGWRIHRVLRKGRYVAVRYTGGSIPVAGYQDFQVLGTPNTEGTSVWSALQTYADGKVKPWIGPPEAPGAVSQESGPTAEGPASAVTITAADAPVAAAPAAAAASSGDSSGAGIWLGVIAIALGALACVAVGLLWSSRPMELPSDDEPPGP